MHRPGVELAISRSQVRRANHYTTELPKKTIKIRPELLRYFADKQTTDRYENNQLVGGNKVAEVCCADPGAG